MIATIAIASLLLNAGTIGYLWRHRSRNIPVTSLIVGQVVDFQVSADDYGRSATIRLVDQARNVRLNRVSR